MVKGLSTIYGTVFVGESVMKSKRLVSLGLYILLCITILQSSNAQSNPIRENAIGLRNFSEVFSRIHQRFEREVDEANLFASAWSSLNIKGATMLQDMMTSNSSVNSILAATVSINASTRDKRDFYVSQIEKTLTLVSRVQPEDATPSLREMWTWTTNGLVGALEDPYSQFLPPKDHEMLIAGLSGQPDETRQFYGVGISVEWDTKTDQGVLVIAPLPGTPAERNGVHAGDIIIGVDNEDLREWEGTYAEKLEKAIDLITGEKGTTVKLKLKKYNSPEPVEISVERAPINPDLQIAREMLDEENKIGRITLSQFYLNAHRDVLEAVRYLKLEGMKKLILDLRYNPGGYLDEAIKVADVFLPKGKLITYTEGREYPKREYFDETTSEEGFSDIPLVILLNEHSASASEVVTGALKDNGRATVVGMTSFGKGSVQEIFELLDGAGLRLTVGHYYTPSGVCIHNIGIKPDIEVDRIKDPEQIEELRNKDFANYSRLERFMELDPQLKTAIRFLRGEITIADATGSKTEKG
jgi:carboxyl-terminal processing protease